MRAPDFGLVHAGRLSAPSTICSCEDATSVTNRSRRRMLQSRICIRQTCPCACHERCVLLRKAMLIRMVIPSVNSLVDHRMLTVRGFDAVTIRGHSTAHPRWWAIECPVPDGPLVPRMAQLAAAYFSVRAPRFRMQQTRWHLTTGQIRTELPSLIDRHVCNSR